MPTKKKIQAKKAAPPRRGEHVTHTVPKKPRKPRSTKKPTARRWHLAPQLVIAGSAIAVLLLLGAIDRITFTTLPGKAAQLFSATIGLENGPPLRLSVLIARKERAGYASILNRSDETIHVSVPSTWIRTEVTGVPLARVTSDIPVFGFTRWTLPAHAGINMLLTEVPSSLLFDSASSATAAIELQTIDLINLRAESRVVLLQKQLLVELWGEN